LVSDASIAPRPEEFCTSSGPSLPKIGPQLLQQRLEYRLEFRRVVMRHRRRTRFEHFARHLHRAGSQQQEFVQCISSINNNALAF
jgi:hypothetical protein